MSKVLFSNLGDKTSDKIFSVVLIAVLIVGGYFGIKFLISRIKNTMLSTREELNTEMSKGGKLSYSDSQFVVFADKLYLSMKGVGTDEETIFAVFNSMNTKADVLKLVIAFGVRDNESLSQWISGDLSFSDISKINKILTTKGIDYNF
jgi:hypothetical protein